ncbi:hypothetical protein ID866_5094 [Astraeus odoratus]|nr:hypothetical protein ID866_5094 [Astraeus odoratus]
MPLVFRPIPLVPGLKFPGGTYNPTHSPLDLYTPRFVRGRGTTKVGLCPVCIESPARGGKGEKVWLSMKFSAYKHNNRPRVKVKELYWWKHAAACHKGTHIEGDDDFFEDDDIHRKIRELFE